MASKKLVEAFNQKQIDSKILEQISLGKTYKDIAGELGISLRRVTDCLKAELMSATTPEKILELREHQTQTLNSHTPRLHKRFLQQTNLSERLANKYEKLIDDEDEGLYSYPYLYDSYIMSGMEPEEANKQAKQEIGQYHDRRERIAKEMERTTKLGNENYQVLLKHQERLAKLNGLDTPTQHSLMIHRSDEIKIDLEMDIKNTQRELQAKQEVLEGEIVEDQAHDG